jgi:hypothetical protein
MMEKISSLRITYTHDFVERFDNGDLNIHKFIMMGSVSSNLNRPMYLLWIKFMIIHYRKARNPNEFPFCMANNL